MTDRMLSMRTEWVAGMMELSPSSANSTTHTDSISMQSSSNNAHRQQGLEEALRGSEFK